MRQQGQNYRWTRGRGRKFQGSSNKVLESNGPDVKVRGTAGHICERYRSLARDAHAAGDRVTAESYLQYAEHYHRFQADMQRPYGEPQPSGAEEETRPSPPPSDYSGEKRKRSPMNHAREDASLRVKKEATLKEATPKEVTLKETAPKDTVPDDGPVRFVKKVINPDDGPVRF